MKHVKCHRHRRSAASQGGSALPDRPRQLRRRHQAAGHGGGRLPALAARACGDQVDRCGGGAGHAGRARGVHGRRSEGCRRRRAALRLGHHRQGWTADERAAASRRWRRARCAMSAIRSPSSSPRRASRRRTPPKRSWSITGAAGGGRRARCHQARRAASVRRCAEQSVLRLGARRQGGDRRRLPQSRACRAHQPGQQPPGRQPDGAARGDRRIQCGDRPLHAVDDKPVSARRAPARWAPSSSTSRSTKLRIVAPDVGGGFGVKQFHYAEEAVDHLGGGQGRAADQMGVRAQRRLHLRRAGPRSRHRGRIGA